MRYPFITMDTETTGTNTREDRIVELCLIKIQADGSKEVKRTLINPEMAIPDAASKIHGIDNEMVKDAPPFRRIAKSLLEFMDGCDIVGYNSNNFDIPLLYAEFVRANILWDYSRINFIDACVIFKRKEERTLSAAVKFYLGRDHVDAHGAEPDTLATIDVLTAQLEKYEGFCVMTNEELALYSNYDKPRCDLAGCFTKDEQGRYVINFGKKHKGELAVNCQSYLEWMKKEYDTKKGFNPDTMEIVYELLK